MSTAWIEDGASAPPVGSTPCTLDPFRDENQYMFDSPMYAQLMKKGNKEAAKALKWELEAAFKFGFESAMKDDHSVTVEYDPIAEFYTVTKGRASTRYTKAAVEDRSYRSSLPMDIQDALERFIHTPPCPVAVPIGGPPVKKDNAFKEWAKDYLLRGDHDLE